jgi:hypothetical protein
MIRECLIGYINKDSLFAYILGVFLRCDHLNWQEKLGRIWHESF